MMTASTSSICSKHSETSEMDTLMEMMSLQKQAEKLLKRNEGLKPAPRLSREDALIQHTRLRAIEEDNEGQTLFSIISEAYPPSIKPLRDLKPILIEHLKVETHHRGRVLFAKTISEPYRKVPLYAVIEDENGEVDRLFFMYSDRSIPPESCLPLGCVIAIKEPFYKCISPDGKCCVRVDHPSDLIVLSPTDDRVPAKFQWQGSKIEDATVWKAKGNAAFEGRECFRALACYTEGLKIAPPDAPVATDLYRNRALINILLMRYEAAMSDCKHALNADPTNIKALYRAGRAKYELGHYEDARDYFIAVLHQDDTDEPAQIELERAEARIAEQNHAHYYWEEMSDSVTPDHLHLDHASYLERVEVGEIEGRDDDGLFAKEDIDAGDVVLCEKAFAAVYDVELRARGESWAMMNLNDDHGSLGSDPVLIGNIIQDLLKNPSRSEILHLCCGDYKQTGKEGNVIDGMPVVDTFLIPEILKYNGFCCTPLSTDDFKRGGYGDGGCGIWITASYINHDCIGNVARSFIGDMMVIRATRDIAAGEEITFRYISAQRPVEIRRQQLNEQYGFICYCNRCKRESKSSARATKAREELVEKILSRIQLPGELEIGALVPAHIVCEVEMLVQALESRYEEKIFAHLPRPLLLKPQLWLTQVFGLWPDYERMQDSALRLLRNYGIFCRFSGAEVNIDTTNALLYPNTVGALRLAAEAFALGGRGGAGWHFESFATQVYEVLTGTVRGYEDTYGNWRERLGAIAGDDERDLPQRGRLRRR